MAGDSLIRCERGGEGGPCLILLHGLGANGAVWDEFKPILNRLWGRKWLIPDFRGHGRSSHRAPYGIGMHAADVAALMEQDEEAIVVGHSMGGVVAIALATGMFGVRVKAAIAFSVKTRWTEEDYARGEAMARSPAKLFDTREEAIERYLRVSGLVGLTAPTSPMAMSGVTEQNGKFRLAADPRAFSLGRPDFPSLAKASLAPVHLLCGDKDGVASPDGMRSLGGDVTVLPGLGHNVQVEAPEILWNAIVKDLT
jgi:pimeloyl-ACP methyl ester carboxylesterase